MPEMSGSFDMDVELNVPEGVPDTTIEVPYVTLVLADLAGGEHGRVEGPWTEGLVAMTADTFDARMASAKPGVNFTLADPTVPGNVMTEVDLTFEALRSFDPLDIASRLPATRQLLEIREELVQRMHGRRTSEQIMQRAHDLAAQDAGLAWLAETLNWSPGKTGSDPGAVDDLLGQLDLGNGSDESATPSTPSKTDIGKLVSSAAGASEASIPAEEASAVRRTLAEIDKRLNLWLNAILHAEPVQTLEAAWRGLGFLVARTDFRKGLKLQVLHSSKADLADRLNRLVLDPIFDEGATAPDLIIAHYAFGTKGPDMELLDELAQHAASLPAVAIADVGAEFFGVKNAWQVPTLPNLRSMFDQWQFAKWKSLRKEDYAESLGVIFGRGLLRTAYHPHEEKDLAYAFKEQCVGEKDLLWSGGSLAVACTVARSVAKCQWPTAVAGYGHGRVAGYATAIGGKRGDKTYGPTDTTMPPPKIQELAVIGVNGLVGVPELDEAIVWNGLTAAMLRRQDPIAVLEVSLAYRLFATRLSALLLSLKPKLAGQGEAETIRLVRQCLCEWLGLEGEPTTEQLNVQINTPDEAPSAKFLTVVATPPTTLLPGDVPVTLGYRLS